MIYSRLNVDHIKDPVLEISKWLKLAEKAGLFQPELMLLSTASLKGQPHTRAVLFKGIKGKGMGAELFFVSNYDSHKGKELLQNPKVALLFIWQKLQLQIRIEGVAKKASSSESDEYWNTRPKESQLAAMASPQSHRISSRKVLLDRYVMLQKKYLNTKVPRPKNWGGYRVSPKKIEFWVGKEHRLHDRKVFERKNTRWNSYRLAP